MTLKQNIRQILRKFGVDVIRYPNGNCLGLRKKIIEHQKINTVLDIGANTGQYAKQLREVIFFNGKIISFEPTSNAFTQLKANAKKDNNWDIYNYALGDCLETKQINIAGNSQSSSLLNMLPEHLISAPKSKYIDKETTEIKTLDSIWDNLEIQGDNVYMKIDAQGFEYRILKGSLKSLNHINTIQIEMSLVPLYDGEILFQKMLSVMQNYGYTLIGLEPGFSNKITGHLLQVNGIFCRAV